MRVLWIPAASGPLFLSVLAGCGKGVTRYRASNPGSDATPNDNNNIFNN
jgi:hypothetical protein